jgi:hypothetical protein
LTQVPPMVPRSISVTFAPSSTALSTAAADHGDVQLALAVAALVSGPHLAAYLVEQPDMVLGRRGIGKRRLVAEFGHCSSQRIRCGAGARSSWAAPLA